MAEDTVLLFSYGTLQQENVQMASFGRLLAGRPDAMPGYRRDMLEITDPEVIATSGTAIHPMLVPTTTPHAAVDGHVLTLTDAQLDAADAYEVDAYVRVSVSLGTGRTAWVYALAE